MKKILLFDNGSTLITDIEKVLQRNNIDYQRVNHDFNCDSLDDYKGIIFSGSPDAVYDGGRMIDIKFIRNDIPKLGICYGHQLCNYVLGGKVIKSDNPEYDIEKEFTIDADNPIFNGMNKKHNVCMYHYDEVVELGEGFISLGHTDGCKYAASYNEQYKVYTLQFHPEADKFNDYCDEYYINFNNICDNQKMA